MRHSVLILLLGAGLLSGTASVAAAAPEVVLHGGFHRGVALALDPSGDRHLVAAKGGGDLWYATDRTGAWVTQRILAAEAGSFVWSNPTIATDDDGRVHIAAVRDFIFDTPGATGGIYYRTDKGRPRGDFGPTVRIAPPMMTSPSLEIPRRRSLPRLREVPVSPWAAERADLLPDVSAVDRGVSNASQTGASSPRCGWTRRAAPASPSATASACGTRGLARGSVTSRTRTASPAPSASRGRRRSHSTVRDGLTSRGRSGRWNPGCCTSSARRAAGAHRSRWAGVP